MEEKQVKNENPGIRSLFERKSVRAFTGQPIPEEEKQLILQTACQAPSAGYQRLYTIIYVRDPKLTDTVA